MPFLHVEEALLGPRRACSSTLFVTPWLLDGYKLDYRRDYTLMLRAFNTLPCNYFSQPYRALYCVKRLPNYSYKHTKKNKKVRPFTCIITLKSILFKYNRDLIRYKNSQTISLMIVEKRCTTCRSEALRGLYIRANRFLLHLCYLQEDELLNNR